MTASTPITRFRPADAARQCEASFIDLGFVVACAGVAALISHDITVTAMIALEAVAVLAVGEGSRGITPGNMMLGLRTVRVEGMHDATAGVLPAGMGRILIKYCMLIASLLAAFVGLPIVMCSPLFSGNDLNQGWANRLASLASVDIRQPIVVQARAPRQRIAMADESNPSIPRTVARRPSSLPTVALPPSPQAGSGSAGGTGHAGTRRTGTAHHHLLRRRFQTIARHPLHAGSRPQARSTATGRRRARGTGPHRHRIA